MTHSALVFAAGFGTRMGEMTKTTPKPMIQVAGRPLLDYALDLVDDLDRIVVNTHYLPDQIETHLASHKTAITIREEPDVLETGGGLKNALPLLGSDPVVTLNSDAVWTGPNPVDALIQAWDPDRMDALLMLIPTENAQEHRGTGDFRLDPTGRISRKGTAPNAPFVYSGAQIIKTDLLADITDNSFSLNLLWDKMLLDQRAFGIVHSGGWVDVGRPEGIDIAAAELANDV